MSAGSPEPPAGRGRSPAEPAENQALPQTPCSRTCGLQSWQRTDSRCGSPSDPQPGPQESGKALAQSTAGSFWARGSVPGALHPPRPAASETRVTAAVHAAAQDPAQDPQPLHLPEDTAAQFGNADVGRNPFSCWVEMESGHPGVSFESGCCVWGARGTLPPRRPRSGACRKSPVPPPPRTNSQAAAESHSQKPQK